MRDLVDVIRPLLNSAMSDIGIQESDWNNLLASSTDSSIRRCRNALPLTFLKC